MTQRDLSYSAPVTRDTTPRTDIGQLSLNHPKNYLGVPLAIAADGDTGILINSHLVTMCGRARDGAEALGLIDCDGQITELGETVVNFSEAASTPESDLEFFASLKGTSDRFCETTPQHLSFLAGLVLTDYQPTQDVLEVLEATGPVVLSELAAFAVQNDHQLADILLRSPSEFSEDSSFDALTAAFADPSVYRGQAVYQFKSLLYHTGILNERSADTSALIPDQDTWAIDIDARSEPGGSR